MDSKVVGSHPGQPSSNGRSRVRSPCNTAIYASGHRSGRLYKEVYGYRSGRWTSFLYLGGPRHADFHGLDPGRDGTDHSANELRKWEDWAMFDEMNASRTTRSCTMQITMQVTADACSESTQVTVPYTLDVQIGFSLRAPTTSSPAYYRSGDADRGRESGRVGC